VRVLLLTVAACSPVRPAGQGGEDPADAGSACGPLAPDPASPCRANVDAVVDDVVDGDTVDVAVEGAQERVRLIGIDAPESDEGTCGSGAESWLRARLPAASAVTLSFDAECADDFDRTLAYLSDAGGMINAALVARGQAQACPYEPNTTYARVLACLEADASAASEGLWARGCHLDDCFE
jgi:micrococcal nuclease